MKAYPIPGFHEPFNALSHLLGAGVFAVLWIHMWRRGRGDARRSALLGVFAFASVLLLAMSGVFHMLREGSAGHAVLGRLDKAAIFVLIAGTHTPVQGLFFRGWARWGGLIAIWLIAATGITLFSVFYGHLPRGLGTAIYILLGWIAGVAGMRVWRRFGTREAELLVVGGVIYSIGAILMVVEWPVLVPGVVGPHEVWHVAVLVALSLHWRFIYTHANRSLDGPILSTDGAVDRGP
ncbi:MAG: DNA-binding protein [bacterium]|nr:DNA-binding protein [bacterium]